MARQALEVAFTCRAMHPWQEGRSCVSGLASLQRFFPQSGRFSLEPCFTRSPWVWGAMTVLNEQSSLALVAQYQLPSTAQCMGECRKRIAVRFASPDTKGRPQVAHVLLSGEPARRSLRLAASDSGGRALDSWTCHVATDALSS